MTPLSGGADDLPPLPVAWRYMRPGGEWFYTDYHDPEDPDCADGVPLYTEPVGARRQGALTPEIRRNEDGTLDEVVGTGALHIEQMDDSHWWLALNYDGDKRVTVNFHARGKITAHAEFD